MHTFLLVRLEAPLQAWGQVAVDSYRPTGAYPSQSAMTGLLASALGWRYRDGARTNQLLRSVWMAVREDRPPTRMHDFQTVDLARVGGGWSRSGLEGGSRKGTHILHKQYLADASLLAAVGLREGSPVPLAEVAEALRRPARPLFLGRKGCPPATPLLEAVAEAESPLKALIAARLPDGGAGRYRFWCDSADRPDAAALLRHEAWDFRDFVTDRFSGSRWIVEEERELLEHGGGS